MSVHTSKEQEAIAQSRCLGLTGTDISRVSMIDVWLTCCTWHKPDTECIHDHVLYAVLCHPPESIRVIIDGYTVTHNSTLTSGDAVPLGNQTIQVCRVVGLPYGTPVSYTWTCPSGPCEVEGYYGRKVYNEHILAVNTTSSSDGGTYTCQVTATGGQEATGSFTLTVTGMPNTARMHIYYVLVCIMTIYYNNIM